MEETKLSKDIQLILFIPRSQYLWSYTIDEGKKHSIDQDDMIKYIENFVNNKEILKLKDIMQRHQPFIINVQNKIIFELHKEDDTLGFYQDQLKKSMASPSVEDMMDQDKTMGGFFKKSDTFFSSNWRV